MVLAATLVIAEINYQPYEPVAQFGETAESASDFEFIELWNPGTEPVALGGMAFIQLPIDGSLEGVTFSFSSGSLAPNERLVVVRDVDAFRSRYGNGPRVAGEWSGGGLNNGGELITLVDSLGSTVFQVAYDSNASWPTRAAGLGASLEIKEIEDDPNDGGNWRSSVEYGGSPGAAPSDRTPRIQINEILAHTDPPDVDTVEFKNLTDAPLDISGWYFADQLDRPFGFYSFPANTIIPANGYLTIDDHDFNPGGATLPSDFLLSERGDDLILISARADRRPLNIEDFVVLGPTPNGITVGNVLDVREGVELLPLAERTLGAANGVHATSKVIISEVHYHPLDDDAFKEYIELRNTTAETVTLSDWRIEEAVSYTVPGGTLLGPHETVVVVPFDPNDVARVASFRTAYELDASVRMLGPWSVNNQGQPDTLSNSGDRLVLREPLDDVDLIVYQAVDRFEYNDKAPWSEAADGDGASLARIAADAYGNAATSWVGSRPSPGDLPPPLESSPVLALGTAVDGVLGLDDTLLRGGTDIDIFRFQPPTNAKFIFTADGLGLNSADTVLRIFSTTGEELAFNDNANLGTTNAKITIALSGGQTYYIVVSGSSPTPLSYDPFTGLGLVAGARGDYRLQAVEDFANAAPWQNVVLPEDVTNDGAVVPLDALLVINELNSRGAGPLPPAPAAPPPYLDVNGDNILSPIDALLVINYLNIQAEGESVPTDTTPLTPWSNPAPSRVNPAPSGSWDLDLIAAAVDQALADGDDSAAKTDDDSASAPNP